ncbi:hypothetical protein AGDE_07138 [Angomonas deanei]|nr:hypothetical protein AGDE_07138 [Angomonas deanei]|eukprot:EPY35990.1 hypothetical protein AGDE_07138 [Angomonas deanei]
MSTVGVFSKGRPAGHEAATAILKYIPRPRVPWQPSRFGRANLTEEDLKQMWGMGRYRDGPANYNSGYSTSKTHVLEDNTINIIPKHELEKYMPDITIGSKALVTPVSLMSARNGHRVTHDMLHSYDPYIGRVQKAAVVDHDNITVEDPNRVGLNASTLDCRGRILRWLRRGPFFQEDHYFRRSGEAAITRDGPVAVSTHEAPLMKKIVRLAHRGHLKAACEEYRKVTSVPPVAVYRALTAACIPGAHLADAIAIFEDGNAKLFYVARDGEVLLNLMECAIAARHRVRVMWVYNTMRGRYYENSLVRAEISPIWQFRIALAALHFLLSANAIEEARTIYQFLKNESLLDCDLYVRVGTMMQEALAEGKVVNLDDNVLGSVALVKNAESIAPHVAAAVYEAYQGTLEGEAPQWSARGTLSPPPTTPKEALEWLQGVFADLDVAAVLRHVRFEGKVDLLSKDQPRYVTRAQSWLEMLSETYEVREEAPLPYLLKSKPSLTNVNVRVAHVTENRPVASRLLASEEGYHFHFDSTQQTRLVQETFRYTWGYIPRK